MIAAGLVLQSYRTSARSQRERERDVGVLGDLRSRGGRSALASRTPGDTRLRASRSSHSPACHAMHSYVFVLFDSRNRRRVNNLGVRAPEHSAVASTHGHKHILRLDRGFRVKAGKPGCFPQFSRVFSHFRNYYTYHFDPRVGLLFPGCFMLALIS